MVHATNLSFLELPTYNLKTIAIVDTSYYNPSVQLSGAVLQVMLPDRPTPIELPFNISGVTILDSSNLGITSFMDEQFNTDLPDGAYTAKISICPYDQFWYESTWYRTARLKCKYHQALLKLDISQCQECFNAEKDNELQTANRFIEGIEANMNQGNLSMCNKLYNAATYILDDILNCNCGNESRGRGWGQGKRHKGNWNPNPEGIEYGFGLFAPTGKCCGN